MRSTKVFLILQVVLMYLAHLPFYFVLLFARVLDSSYDDLLGILFLVGFILTIVIIPIAFVNIILGFITLFKGNNNPYKITMIIKLSLIPWYVLNFLIGLVTIGVFANPWLLIAVPLVLLVLVSSTYLFMIATSVYDVFYMINKFIKREQKVSAFRIISLILLCVFTLDIVSSIILCAKYKLD